MLILKYMINKNILNKYNKKIENIFMFSKMRNYIY